MRKHWENEAETLGKEMEQSEYREFFMGLEG